jgi:pilus assembly protein Flp/PilA
MHRNSIFTISENQDGATAIEYGLIAALVSIAIIAGLTLVGTDIANSVNIVSNSL